jgi:hypothetical protein
MDALLRSRALGPGRLAAARTSATGAAGARALPARSGTAGAPGSARALRAILVWCESPIAVLVEFLQRLTGLGEFVGVNRAVVI